MSKKENDHEKTIHENNDSDNTKKKNVKAEKKKKTSCTELTRDELLTAYRTGEIVPENNGASWTDDDRERLRILYNCAVGLSEIALQLHRSERAIYMQLDAMDLLTTEQTARGCRSKRPVCKCTYCTVYDCEHNPHQNEGGEIDAE